MKSRTIGYVMAIFTIMMWSLNIIYSKYLAGVLTPSEISFYRWFIALFIMLPISYHGLKQDWRKILKHWKLVLIMALSGIGFLNFFIYYAGYTASATNMSLISILGPIFLIVISRQKVDIFQVLGISMAIFGVVVIILRGDFSNLAQFTFVPGDIYMLISAFLFAVYSAIQKKAPSDIHPTALLTAAIFVAAVIFFFPALPDMIKTPIRSVPDLAWGIMIILGIVNSALAYLSWDIVLQKIGTVGAGTMYYTMPIFSIFFAHLLLHEKIYSVQIWGGVAIVIGIAFVVFGAARVRRKLDRDIPRDERRLEKDKKLFRIHPEQ